MSSYAISDIHGCILTFERLLHKIAFSKTDKLFLLGDYVDRGPESFKVIQLIINLRAEGYDISCLKGNHEDMMIDVLNRKSDITDVWLRNGGIETLHSYDLTARTLGKMEKSHLKFYKSLEYYIHTKDKLLVHAGFNFAKRDIYKDKQSMLWIREWHEYYDRRKAKDRQIIHGHTPTSRHRIEELIDMDSDCLVIDNGCIYTERVGMGHLCAINLGTMNLTFQKCLDA